MDEGVEISTGDAGKGAANGKALPFEATRRRRDRLHTTQLRVKVYRETWEGQGVGGNCGHTSTLRVNVNHDKCPRQARTTIKSSNSFKENP
ncbi:unannotated protein [freshwater metagenome]|uniref:Unannotated protein n=1 Tax=freshwater metagenome TaxID=449393 RepID=A0A6J6WAF8_9ZZZZ